MKMFFTSGSRTRSTSFRHTGSFRGIIKACISIVVPLSVGTVLTGKWIEMAQ